MKPNRSLILTLFVISTIVFVGACEKQVDAATQEFIFNEYTIRVDSDVGRPLKYGILDVVEVNTAGDLALLSTIREVSVTDASGMQVSWEEGQSILAQALGRPFSPVEASDMKWFPIEHEGTTTSSLFSAFDLSDKMDKIKSRATRAHFFRDAVLRAVVLEQTVRLYPDLLSDVLGNSLQLLGLANTGAKVGVSAYQHLRQVEDYRKALEHGQAISKNELAKKVAHRIHKSPLGKSVRALGVLNVALELADNINDEIRQNALMAEMAKDVIILKGLEDTLLFMKGFGGYTDPAMIDGMEMALDDLAVVSKDRLKAVATGIGKTTPTLLRYLGPQVLKLSGKALKAAPKVGKIVKVGASGLTVALEVVELVNILNDFEKAVFTVSALTTLGNYLEGWIPYLMRNGWDLDDLQPAGFPVRELISFYERVVSEEAAGLYNMAWNDRWSITSVAALGRGIGTQWAEWKAKLKGKAWDREGYEEWSQQTAMNVRHTQELYAAIPTFLNQLKQVYVPRPTSEPEPTPESTSLADIALIIDSSGSMGGPGGNDPNNLRKSGAELFIDSADPKVQIAIIDFEAGARKLAPLTFADTPGKLVLKNAVAQVHSSGSSTNIDAGLQQGFQALNASTSAAKKAAVLLTDGVGRVEQQALSNYAARGWPVYTIGLGSGVDRRELERIAQATGGEYFYAAHDYHIQTVYSVILAKTTGQSTLASYAGYINKGQQITRKVLIDNTVDQANISCNWQGSTIDLMLIDPDGTQITPRDAAANPRITYKPAATYAIYTLENPKVGNWQIQATGTDIPPQGEPFNLTVSATSDFFTSLLSFDSSYTVGETIQIGIKVQEKTGDTFAAVLGATTAAKVVRPDGRIDTLNLYDDGSHNDRAANDGVYANNYRSVDKQGTYLIKVTAENGFSREIQKQVVVGSIDNVLIDGSTLTPTAGAALKQTPSVISAVISGPAGRINHNSIVLKVDRNTVSHTYDSINQLVSYRPSGLSSGEHSVQLSVRDTSGNAIETTWSFSTQVADALTERTTLTGHTHIVYSVAFSPNGQTLASGSGDNTIRLWDVNTGTEIKKLIGHTSSVNSVAFSPNGQTLASGSWDDTIRLWDVNTGTEIKKLIGHTGYVWDVTFSPDGQTIASTSVDQTVRLWDVATGTHETLTRHSDEVSSLSFSPDGQTIAGGSWDGTVRLWDVNTGTQRKILIGHKGLVWDVSFSPDGQTLASGSGDRTLHLWHITTGVQHQILTGHTQGVYSVAFSPDGQTLASGSADRIICLWDVTTGTQRQTLTGHTDTVLSVAFSPDGQTLASGGNDNTIRLWGAAPDVQPPALAADVNGDGVVDIQDMKLVHTNLGKYGQNDADVNGDGIVNAEDIALVLAAIEAAGGAPARHTQMSHLFTTEEVQQWLTEARQFADKSPAHRRGVLLLEQLLTLLTPEETVLLPNYPNPFNPETWIPYRLAKPAEVILTIYAVNGQVVRTLDLGHQAAGFYEGRSRAAYWDGRNAQGEPVASGVYFYTLTAGDFSATRKMLIMK